MEIKLSDQLLSRSFKWKPLSELQGSLRGVRVVDLSRVLAGPLCTQMCADHGADVIKIEPPFGDETRLLGPPFDENGTSAYFSAVNRGKRAFTLDLTEVSDRDKLLSLISDADVLVENFLPGTMERWGLGYEKELKDRFPRLIYCKITGFGSDGPMGGLPGYDAIVQAVSGLMSINGTEDSGPTKVGVPIVDHLTAYVAFSGINMALLARHQDGLGQLVEATLYDAALSLLIPHASNWLYSGEEPKLLGSQHPNIAPYNKFSTKNGELFVGILNDNQFKKFADCLGHPDLALDTRFKNNQARLENQKTLKQQIEFIFKDWDKEELCKKLMKIGVPAGSINSVSEALLHPHTEHREMLIHNKNYHGLGNPIKMSRTKGVMTGVPPLFNQHEEVKNKI